MRGGPAGRERVRDDAVEGDTVNGSDGSIAALVAAHLETWNSPNGPDRQRSIAAVYSADVTIGEPGARHTGHAGMDDAISALHDQLPNTTITRSGPIQTAQELVTYPWVLGVVGQPPMAAGRDVLLVVDGAITHVFVVIDDPE
jgi:hypothetical protein